MRADRLISILLCLQTFGKMTTRSLSEKLEVSERTILRDMDALCASGVPIVSERGASGGWNLLEGYRTNLTGLKKPEIQSLLLANANATSILGDLGLRASFDMASLKLLASLPLSAQEDAARVRQRIHVDGAGWYKSSDQVPCLAAIQDAIWQELKLQIKYEREGQEVERLVDPLGIVVKGTIWYLIAGIDGEIRTYRVSRIKDVIITDLTFERPAEFELAEHWEQSTQDFKANLPCYPALIKLKAQVFSQFQKERFVTLQEIRSSDEDWMILGVHYQTLETACRSVLSYSTDLEVIEPAELRNQVYAAAASILKLYA